MDILPNFDEQQLHYLHDTHFLITKRKIIHQLQELLAVSEQELKKIIGNYLDHIPADCLVVGGKISRGENYRGLPYLVLDYPRLFKNDDIFTFRTMFWWGQVFSCTLHLQGEFFSRYRETLRTTLFSRSYPADTFICVNASPWEYHFQPDNYLLLGSLAHDRLEALLENKFIKLSRKLELNDYQMLPSFTRDTFSSFIDLLHLK